MRISITNHTGARNRGCEALVVSKILGLKKAFGDADFYLHTNDPLYDAWRFGEQALIRWGYLTSTPNHFSSSLVNKTAYKVFGVAEKFLSPVKGVDPRSIDGVRSSDLVVASGGDIFTSDYGNLRKHLSYPLVASGKKVYLCGHSIGPFKGKDESYFLRAMERVAAVSAREKETYEYLKSIDVQTCVYHSADVAFTLPVLGGDDVDEYLEKCFGVSFVEPVVAISISQGIIKYSGLDKGAYYNVFAGLCDELIVRGKVVLLIPHVMEKNPDNNDLVACYEVVSRMAQRKGVRIMGGEPSAIDFKTAIARCEGLIGTRTHATIASMSQCVPTVSIAYSRKAYGIMADVYGEHLGKELTIPSSKISVDGLLEAYDTAQRNKIDSVRMEEIKVRAQSNFEIARGLMDV